MKVVKINVVVLFLSLLAVPGNMKATELAPATKKTRNTLINSESLTYGARFAANASLAFFALGQSSYHLGNLLAGCWLEQQFKTSPGYKQAIRFCVGMVGTSILLGLVNCLDQFGYANAAGNIEAGLAQTEGIVDGTPQAPTS